MNKQKINKDMNKQKYKMNKQTKTNKQINKKAKAKKNIQKIYHVLAKEVVVKDFRLVYLFEAQCHPKTK
jgi:hypothetical protein